MIHEAFNKTVIAQRYYRKLGKFTTRDQAKKNFAALKKPDQNILMEIFDEIMHEQMELLK